MGRHILIGLAGGALLLTTGYVAYDLNLAADQPTATAERLPASEPAAAGPSIRIQLAAESPARPPHPVRLDPRCEKGRVLCADKTTNTLRWVVDGAIRMTLAARFGGPRHQTREGVFEVYDKLRYHVSSIYGTQMPFAMFFSGGQAVHYSKEFAAHGYRHGSHGCINLRNHRAAAKLFKRVDEGDKVVVYRS